jgi:peroxiredoxin
MTWTIRNIAVAAATSAAAAFVLSVASAGLFADNVDEEKSSVGKTISRLGLTDTTGKSWQPADLKGNKATIVLFVGTECPINNSYMPRLVEVQKEYAEKKVQLLAINSNQQDTPARIAAHVKEYGITFPVLRDHDFQAADQFGAKRTPEAFVLDEQLKIVYHGRIDDRFGLGFQRPKAQREDLISALDELLAGKKVSVPFTPVAGCLIGRAAPAKETRASTVNYAKHVAPIIQNRCQECHRPGQIGPMALMSFDDASSWSAMIREVVESKRMPPWHADAKYHGVFTNERALTQREYDTLLRWVDEGCPKGADTDLPAPRQFADTWYIGKPDAVFEMPEEYTVPAKAGPRGIPYKHFMVKTDFDEDKWIQAAECKPGNRAVVHHIIAYVNVPGAGRDVTDGLGKGMFGAYAPGDLGFVYPAGAAKKLPKGANIIFQVHYTPNGVEGKDRSSVGVVFAKEPPKMEVQMRAVMNALFQIPPNAASHAVTSESTFKKDAILFSLLPHMHLRGKDFKYDVVYPDGTSKTILEVPRYDFGWQATYHFKEPLKLPAGSKLKCLAHFDNSRGNPWNPDPTVSVRFGEQTWEEMMIGFVDYAFVPDAPK